MKVYNTKSRRFFARNIEDTQNTKNTTNINGVYLCEIHDRYQKFLSMQSKIMS